jgi:hypothetical protein
MTHDELIHAEHKLTKSIQVLIARLCQVQTLLLQEHQINRQRKEVLKDV